MALILSAQHVISRNLFNSWNCRKHRKSSQSFAPHRVFSGDLSLNMHHILVVFGVKSMKIHLRRIVSNVKLTFEEFTTVLVQIEACLSSRPLTSVPCDDGVDALTPGHFLIGRPLESLPDPAFSYRSISLLCRWHLCQSLVCHFWQRWYRENITTLRRFTKWHRPSRNVQLGDVVILQENGLVPGKWPLARITEVHTGRDGLVRVATIKTANGTYKRPITKLAVLLPCEN